MVSYFFWGEGARRTAPGAFILFLLFGWNDFYCTIAEKMLVMAIRMQTGTAGVFDLLADEATNAQHHASSSSANNGGKKQFNPPCALSFVDAQGGACLLFIFQSTYTLELAKEIQYSNSQECLLRECADISLSVLALPSSFENDWPLPIAYESTYSW